MLSRLLVIRCRPELSWELVEKDAEISVFAVLLSVTALEDSSVMERAPPE